MISFDKVTKVYDQKSKPALDKIDLGIERGEFVFLVGASGSGKSSCIRLILREELATRGVIDVAGQNVGKLSSRRVPKFRQNIGIVFQDFRLLPNKTTFGNVAFAMQVLGKPNAIIKTAVSEVLKTVGLEGKEDRMPHELSGGEQQRVAIARAVVNKPSILLADEPTGNLDLRTSLEIMKILDKINQNGTTVVMATHDGTIVNEMRKRVIELREGRMVRDAFRGVYEGSENTATQDIIADFRESYRDDSVEATLAGASRRRSRREGVRCD